MDHLWSYFACHNRFKETIPWQISEMPKIDLAEASRKKFSFGLNGPEFWYFLGQPFASQVASKVVTCRRSRRSRRLELLSFRNKSVGMLWDGFWHVLVVLCLRFLQGFKREVFADSVAVWDLSHTWYPCKELRWSHPCLQGGKLYVYSKITYAWNYVSSIYSCSYVVVIYVLFHWLIYIYIYHNLSSCLFRSFIHLLNGLSIHLFIYLRIYLCMYLGIMYLCMHARMYSMYVCMHVCLFACMYINLIICLSTVCIYVLM